MISILGLLLVHGLGAVVVSVVHRDRTMSALTSPSSLFVGLAVLFCGSVGWSGLILAALLAFGLWWAPREQLGRLPWRFHAVLALIALWVLARPWVPLYWDEFVWLAKSRLGSQGFSSVVAASLDPTQALIPAGYVPLWPSAVGWLSLGTDSLDAQVVAASLLVVLSVGVALESWWPLLARARGWAVVVVLGAPLVLVHLRSVYVDLVTGLLGIAVLGKLLEERAGVGTLALGVCLAAFKDEGVTQLLSAFLAVSVVRRGSVLELSRRAGPMVMGLATFALWRVLLYARSVEVSDHAFASPQWGWLSTLGRLVVLHASDVTTWGVTWAVALAVVARRMSDPQSRALRWMLTGQFVLLTAALVSGPERVRVFAENGTLLNRLLLQAWPAAALLLLAASLDAPSASPTSGASSARLTDRAA